MTSRGFIDWKPARKSLDLIDMVLAILDEYSAELPLTMRQVFYRGVGQYGYDKTERAYKNLLYCAAKARRAELIPFEAIRDDGVMAREPFGFNGLSDFDEHIRLIATTYQRNRLIGQDRKLIVLCEAAGMVPQIARVAHEFGVPVQSSGGYDSLTAKYDLAVSIASLDAPPATILHIGDLDPSGEDIFVNIQEDVGAFVAQLGSRIGARFDMRAHRIAVTRQQADEMQLPTSIPKATDSRTKNFHGETVQCEAIPPNALSQIVRDEIRSRLNMRVFAANLQREIQDSRQIDHVMAELSFVGGTA